MLGRVWALFALRRYVRLVWRLLKDPRVPATAKIPVPVALLYVLSPVDVAPDLLPLLGQIDDFTLLFLAAAAFLKLCPPEVVREQLEIMAGRTTPRKQRQDNVIEGEYKIVK